MMGTSQVWELLCHRGIPIICYLPLDLLRMHAGNMEPNVHQLHPRRLTKKGHGVETIKYVLFVYINRQFTLKSISSRDYSSGVGAGFRERVDVLCNW